MSVPCMDWNHHGFASGGDGIMLARGGESRPSRELDDHGANVFCAGSNQHQPYIGSHSSPVHDSLPSHNHTWRDGSQYIAPNYNYTQAPYDFAEYPPQASQPYSQYGDQAYSYPEHVYHNEVNYDLYSFQTRQVQQFSPASYLPDYFHRGYYPSSTETLSSPGDFPIPSPSQISTYSSLSNALDGPVTVRRAFTSCDVPVPEEQTIPTPLMARTVPPMGMLPLGSPMAPAASTPSSTSLHTPTFSPSIATVPQTFEVIQDDSAFPSYEKARKRQQAPSGLLSTESSSPFTTEPLVTSTASVALAPLPASVQKTAKASRGAKGKNGPRKKLNLACLFCRERKIACALPSEDDEEKRCNQCVKRSRACQMPPGGSRRGQYARRKASKENTDDIADTTSVVDGLILASPV